jgi:hypothetical protein
MSNSLAISAATRTLLNLLTAATPNVTALPLDKAREELTAEQLNLFLYRTPLSAAWRNADPPRQVRPGETALPALPLSLHYLLTAYGDTEAVAHEVFGSAMSILHDHPVLGADEISDATSVTIPGSDLHLQAERIRITPLDLPVDELSKLWTGFQTSYRLSAAFELSVVLIDSTRPPRSPLPVLRQGADWHGPVAVAGGAPTLAAVLPPLDQPVSVLGSQVRLLGGNLGAVTAVRFASPRLDAPLELPPAIASAEEGTVSLPSGSPAVDEWAPGLYAVSLVTARLGLPAWAGDGVPFGLGTQITVAPSAVPAGPVDLTVTCVPRLRAGQHVQLVFGDRQAAPASVDTPADTTQPSTLTFHLDGVTAGTYVVRLRVDGVDSNPVVRTGTPPVPAFDPAQQVIVQ